MPIKDRFDDHAHSLSFPVFFTSSYDSRKDRKYRYSRELNPTVEELSRQLSLLENTERSICFSSGMGAITGTILALAKPGDKLVMPTDVFGRTYLFAKNFLTKFGINVKFVEPGTDSLLGAVEEHADIVFFESLSNPLLRLYDVDRICRKASDIGAITIVDNTLATPILLKPSLYGCDIIIESLSKFIGGHNNAIGGSASGSLMMDTIDENRRSLGSSMDPMSAYLFILGLKTIDLRIKRSSETAKAIARFLNENNFVSKVYYPGLSDNSDNISAKTLLNGSPPIVSFLLDEGKDVQKFMESLRIITPANTMGGSNSTISNPYTMSHRNLSEDEKLRLGITKNLMRLSVGLEDLDQIIQDLEQAIKYAQ
ncbi:cystathionine beta lyase / O-succinylhomoserine lyase [Thermoplasma volcanium GSS1]|uniref:Cystathionine beta lyase / O-succinylhomoserine lyase n=1 Tax=Thermoplasma volcanium (strain ATCC 51530 / DSM 4299 / JCM 9571 / NBRC 15438 / GSS1) TaxID=273116 RepID=Q979X4_THEVO|nr:cystathionine beta lyase / O-succinylhomoserine lyase [Thermoplasma volcanium GSS1]